MNAKKKPTSVGDQEDVRVPCEVYSRIVGYLRPVQNWHQGKQQEFKERTPFRAPDGVVSHGEKG